MREINNRKIVKHLLFSLDFPPQTGGVSNFLKHRMLNRNGVELHALAPISLGFPEFDRLSKIKTKRFKLRFQGVPLIRRLFQLVQGFYHTRFIIEQHSIRVLELGTALPGSFIGWLMKWHYPIRTATFIHGNDILRPQRYSITNWMLRKGLFSSDIIIANSDFSAKLLNEYNIEEDRIIIINPPVDLERFRPNLYSEHIRERYGIMQGPLLLTVSRLYHGRKGFRTVFESLRLIRNRHPDAHLLVVGSGPALKSLKAEACALGIGSMVTFAGHVSDEEIPAYYSASDIFVMVSVYNRKNGDVEGYGTVYSEAHACEKPCIASNTGGATCAVTKDVDGLLVSPDDPIALAEALLRLICDPVLAQMLGKEGRRRLERKQYNWEQLNSLGL